MALKPREAKYIEGRLLGKSGTESAIYAGYSPKTARQQSYILSKKQHIIDALQLPLEELGITFERAAKAIAEGLNATKTVVHGANSDDAWVDEVPDHTTRLKAAQMALKLLQAESGRPIDNTTKTPQLPTVQDFSKYDEVQLREAIFIGNNNS